MSINHILSVRSDHSIGESIMQVGTLVERAKAYGYKSVGIVDTMSISSLVEFTNKCKKAEIKPIIGCTVRVYEDPTYRKPSKKSGEAEKPNPMFTVKVYVKTQAGVTGLMKLLTKGNSEENFYYNSRVGMEDLLKLQDVIITTGDMFNMMHNRNHVEKLKELLTSIGRDNLFVELVPINTPLFDTLNQKALAVARELDLQLVAGHPVFYEREDQADSLDVLRAITSNGSIGSRTLPIPYSRDLCFDEPRKLVERLVDLSKRIPGMTVDDVRSAMQGIDRIVNACNYEFKKLEPSLPKMAEDEFIEMVNQCKAGWNRRFSGPVLGDVPTDLAPYKERLAYELGVIKKLGFSTYFLVVQHIVNWSKDNGVIVGPGRGSVGGSLIAYLMGITDVDPIRFNLLFERFINPDRIDLPDADLDFMSSRRHEVVKYIIERFGQENVAGISNYSTLGPASAIRDVSRVHNLEIFEYNCSKQVEKEHGVSVGLEESAAAVPDIAKFKEKYPVIWGHAVQLEGCMRNLGQHAAGVIVAGEPIGNRAVLKKPDEDGLPVVYWDKQVVEDWGLIKMDILGLSTLDILKLAVDYIRQRHGVEVDLLQVPLDQEDVMAAFAQGRTIGVFQFEGSGMQNLLRQLGSLTPLNFEDIAAATALYRPGPIDAGLVDKFIAVKQGMSAPEYEHPSMIPALENTYGVLTYQEQIMQVCRDLAGFSMIEADHVRKAMGKKDMEKMQEQSAKFIAGAVAAGMGNYEAQILWDKIAGFAGYCFNRSHSVEYSIISYWCMWLKVRYPVEFYAAAMSVVDKVEKLTSLVEDAKASGIQVLPPDINLSSERVEIANDNTLLAPFQAVKGISENVTGHIMKVRELRKTGIFKEEEVGGVLVSVPVLAPEPSGLFESKEQFELYVSKAGLNAKINSGHREKLDKVGAFASITPGALPASHPSRLKDRLEFMPGFTTEVVKATRGISADTLSKVKITSLIEELRVCDGCSLRGNPHPIPRLGSKPKFMMVFDCPDYKEGNAGKLLESDTGAYVKAALKDAGLSMSDGYFTTLVKSPKPKGVKALTNDMINGCKGYLQREIEILKPPIIIAMGSNAVKYFAPGIKGAPADYSGKVIFNHDLDANIILGINPSSLHFDGSKITLLQGICEKLSSIVS
ncbi:DNA polymerase III subunit alpha [Methylobacillus sp.]|uniref:DNA polymerase III subunit alpha n=1 Tax=Methylobacillus sp. TaxID=56818 RepID=UPI0012C196DD|nr:DNA polymerase III subunit alpha [Methylobacillus sp.]MPS48472.1 DNA polymerase III subunit alpha [Methylobacillus sp.]